jgi:outer membrane protein assembly factor BamB
MSRSVRLALVVVVATGIGLVTPMARASPPAVPDVPAYRGDAARTGRMPGPCPSHDPKEAWKVRNDAPFASSAVVTDGAVILPDDLGVVHAYDATTGILRWEHDLGTSGRPSPPTVTGHGVVIGDAGGMLHALDVSDGTQSWAVSLDGPIPGSPALADDQLVIATLTSSYRVDPSTGAIRRRAPLPGPATRSVAIDGGTAYVPAGRWLVAEDLATGAPRWQRVIGTDGDLGTPVVVDGVVYDATGLGLAEPSAHGLSAMDAATGTLRWRYTTSEDALLFGPAVDDAGRVFVVGHDSRVVALDPATGTPLWMVQLTSSMDTAPVLACGLLFVATVMGDLWVLDPTDGSTVATARFGGRPGGLAVTGGMVLIPTYLGELHAFTDPASSADPSQP